MYEQSSVYVVLLALSAGVSAFTAWIAWSRRKIPGAYSVVFFLVGLCFWSLTYALFWASPLFMRPFWLNVTYFGVVTAPVAFFVFTLYQTGRRRWISRRRNLALLFVMRVVCFILLRTDPLHVFFFAVKQTAGSSVILDGGPGFWANLVYLYGLMLIGTVLLAQAWRQSHPVFRAQAGLVLFAALLPWVSNIISLSGLNPLHGLDLTPMSFTLTGLILTYSLYRTGLLDLAPVARSQVVETMTDSVIVIDGRQRIIDTNPAADALLAALSGSQQSPVGQPLDRLLPAWAHGPANSPLTEFTAHVSGVGGADEQERSFRVAISPLLNAHGVRQGTVLVGSDVTEQKRLEAALQQNLTYLRAIFETSTDAIFILEADTGRILDTNVRATEIFGYTREALIDSNDMNLFLTGTEPYTKANALVFFQRARNEGPQAFEWLGRSQQNEQLWLDMRIRHARLGDTERFVMTVNDITERKRTQQRDFELALERERVQILEHFIRDASHEFRTPLATIRTSLYLLGRSDEPAHRQRKMAQIDREVTRLTRLIEMQVTLTALDSGLALDVQPVDLNGLVRKCAETERDSIETTPRLELDLADDVGLIDMDADLMREALRQLVDNAIQYSDAGGVVTVSTRRHCNTIQIEIRDSGRGISAQVLPHIFDRFFRVDSAHTSPGFGLGLPIAKRIVEAHGGQVSVASQAGQGSVFTVALPVKRGGPLNAPALAQVDGHPG